MAPFGKTIPVLGLNLGFMGNVTRSGERVIAAAQVLPTTPTPVYFGDSVVIVGDSTGGTVQSVRDYITANGAGAMTAALFSGVAVRNVKTNLTFPVVPGTNFAGYFAQSEIAEFLERGSILVPCNNGSPQRRGKVWLRVTYNGTVPAGVVGQFEAVVDPTNAAYTIDMTSAGLEWRTGVVDSNGMCELTLRNRVAA